MADLKVSSSAEFSDGTLLRIRGVGRCSQYWEQVVYVVEVVEPLTIVKDLARRGHLRIVSSDVDGFIEQ